MDRVLATAMAALGLLLVGCGSGARTPEPTPGTSAVEAVQAPAATASTSAGRSITLEVGGMICQDCADKVQKSLASVDGVHRVDVSLDDRLATVVADPAVADTALTGAVRRAGAGYLGFVRH